MATRHLTAFIEGNPVGTLLQDEKGLIYFHYNPGYDGPRCRSRFQSPPASTGKPKWSPTSWGFFRTARRFAGTPRASLA